MKENKVKLTPIYYPIKYDYVELSSDFEVLDEGQEVYYLKAAMLPGGRPVFPKDRVFQILNNTALLGLFLDADNHIIVDGTELICRKPNGDTLKINNVIVPENQEYLFEKPEGHHNIVYGIGDPDMLI